MNLTPSPALTTCKQSVNSRQFIQSGFPDPPDTLFPVFVNQPSRPRADPPPSPTIPPIPVSPPPPTQSGLSPQHQEKESPDPAPPGSPTQANRRPRVRCSARRAGASRTPGAGHSAPVQYVPRLANNRNPRWIQLIAPDQMLDEAPTTLSCSGVAPAVSRTTACADPSWTSIQSTPTIAAARNDMYISSARRSRPKHSRRARPSGARLMNAAMNSRNET